MHAVDIYVFIVFYSSPHPSIAPYLPSVPIESFREKDFPALSGRSDAFFLYVSRFLSCTFSLGMTIDITFCFDFQGVYHNLQKI